MKPTRFHPASRDQAASLQQVQDHDCKPPAKFLSKVNLCSKQRRMSSATALAKINTVNRKRLCSSDQLTSSLLPHINTARRSAAQQMTFASSSLSPGINTAQHSAAQQTGFTTRGSRRSLTAPTSDFKFWKLDFAFQVSGQWCFKFFDSRPWHLAFTIWHIFEEVQTSTYSQIRFQIRDSDLGFRISIFRFKMSSARTLHTSQGEDGSITA
jgi:hypothetical protein